MQYLLLIYEDEKKWSAKTEAEKGAIFGEYGTYTAAIKKSGNFVAGEALQPIATATSVRVRDGKPLTTDGPFAETREQLGGYYLVEAKNLDEAISLAARIPAARDGTIEIRPVLVFDQ
jgi:hypothetical protein